MRNTQVYPITRAERITALRQAIIIIAREANIGDIRPLALAEILREEEAKQDEEEHNAETV